MAGSVIVMGLETYRRYWADAPLTGIGVHFAPGVETGSGIERLRAALGERRSLRVRSTESIERLSLGIFDRTFEITEVLRFLAGCVAFLGVLSAALALELERAREHAILRSVGWSRRQLRALILTETGLLGVAAGLAAIPLGAVLAAMLVYVINQRSFGWSMDLVITPTPLLLGAGLAVTAALLAGIYPAVRGSRVSLDAALRDE
jgi:putative ABC transport system permease protein